MNSQNLIHKIFNISNNFPQVANEVFEFQYQHNLVYKKWCDTIKFIKNNQFSSYPFLPISFFKSHKIISTNYDCANVFESSGTTNSINSKHYIYDLEIYRKSFLETFINAYEHPKNLCIIGLLPSYLERSNSSLVFMVDELIKQSTIAESGFYLYDFEKLFNTLTALENKKQKTILFGVTYALLDFAEQYTLDVQYTTIVETGGMKGRKKEMTKDEVHAILKQRFGANEINSEYGMTELLSQAYATKNNIHHCPKWMKVLVRDEEDPLLIKPYGKGVINIIDLANIYSCSFIATDDVGEVFEDGSFKIFGRLDNSDLRGCSLLYA